MSFSDRSQLPPTLHTDRSFARSLSPKTSALVDLRDDVDQLRIDNKLLARQLHTNRYVSKSKVQRLLNDFRAENLRLQRENAAGKDRVNAMSKQAVVKENTLTIKKKETDEILKKISHLDNINQDLRYSIYTVKSENKVVNDVIDKTKKDNDEIMKQIHEVEIACEEEEQMTKELERSIEKSCRGIEKLKKIHETKLNEMQSCKEDKEKLLKKREDQDEEKKAMVGMVKNNKNEITELKAKIRKAQKEWLRMKKKQEEDKAKHSVILQVLQDKPKLPVNIQTDPFINGGDSAKNIGKGEAYDRGSIVRVVGLGGNTKRKFGKDLEIRATSYSRHVNLNVKLNK